MATLAPGSSLDLSSANPTDPDYSTASNNYRPLPPNASSSTSTEVFIIIHRYVIYNNSSINCIFIYHT
jgi:hypothetical protein